MNKEQTEKVAIKKDVQNYVNGTAARNDLLLYFDDDIKTTTSQTLPVNMNNAFNAHRQHDGDNNMRKLMNNENKIQIELENLLKSHKNEFYHPNKNNANDNDNDFQMSGSLNEFKSYRNFNAQRKNHREMLKSSFGNDNNRFHINQGENERMTDIINQNQNGQAAEKDESMGNYIPNEIDVHVKFGSRHSKNVRNTPQAAFDFGKF